MNPLNTRILANKRIRKPVWPYSISLPTHQSSCTVLFKETYLRVHFRCIYLNNNSNRFMF